MYLAWQKITAIDDILYNADFRWHIITSFLYYYG